VVVAQSVHANDLLQDISRVGTVAIDEIFATNPDWRRLALRSYPWVARSPEHIVKAASLAAQEPRMLPPLGYKPLRDRVAADLTLALGHPVAPELIAITNGAQAALQLVWIGLLNSGDRVVVPTPNYYAEGAIRIAGGVFKPVRAVSEHAMAWERIEAAIDPATKALYLTNPNNPVGYLLKTEDIAVLEEILARNPNLWVVVDESYERITHDGRRHLPAWSNGILRDRSVMIRSLSKSFALTWLRVGWLAAPARLMPLLLKVIEWQQLYGSYLNQSIALAALEGDKGWLVPAFHGFSEGRDFLHVILSKIRGCRVGLPEAGPFLFPDISALGAEGGSLISVLRSRGISAVEGRYFGVTKNEFRMPIGGSPALWCEAASIISTVLGGRSADGGKARGRFVRGLSRRMTGS
jgi:aminotransferase